ncbi:MAG: hypothetical protein WAV04_00285 [Candidatus Microsaccharimonas sp.]
MIIAIILIAAGTVTAYVLLRPKDTVEQASQTQPETEAPVINATSQKAQTLAAEGNTKEAYSLLNKEIENTTSGEVKSELYSTKAVIASSDPNAGTDTALEYALQADQAAPTASTAAFVAYLYETKGDIANAIRYYELARDRDAQETAQFLSENPDVTREGLGDGAYYTSKIEALQNG